MIFRALLSTDKKDLPLAVDEEEVWKYELPTIVLRRSGAEGQLRARGAVIRHIRVGTRRGLNRWTKQNTSHSHHVT